MKTLLLNLVDKLKLMITIWSDVMDLFNNIQSLTEKLNHAINVMAKYGKKYAEAEKNYKVVLRQEALKLRAEKNMPVTLIQQVVYGVPDVADKRVKRDIKR